jgi:hypothetical protein
MIADRHLWLDVKREKLCEEGAPEADFLLAPRGGELSPEQVAQYHLVVDAEGRVSQAAPAAEPEAPAPKRRSSKSEE